MPDPLMDDRIVNAIDSEPTAKGWDTRSGRS
jgi:hypothetical protein